MSAGIRREFGAASDLPTLSVINKDMMCLVEEQDSEQDSKLALVAGLVFGNLWLLAQLRYVCPDSSLFDIDHNSSGILYRPYGCLYDLFTKKGVREISQDEHFESLSTPLEPEHDRWIQFSVSAFGPSIYLRCPVVFHGSEERERMVQSFLSELSVQQRPQLIRWLAQLDPEHEKRYMFELRINENTVGEKQSVSACSFGSWKDSERIEVSVTPEEEQSAIKQMEQILRMSHGSLYILWNNVRSNPRSARRKLRPVYTQ